MKAHSSKCLFLIVGLVVSNIETSVFGQPRPVSIPKLERSMRVNSISKLRVAEQSEDGTELTLIMQYEYNGRNGSSALLVPIVDRKDQPDVARWFGADMITVPSGSGPVSVKVRFFNDEPGAPAAIETDRVRVLILNQTGSSIIGGKNLLRTVRWGSDDPILVSPSPKSDRREELIQLATEAEERARNEAKIAADVEKAALNTLESSQNDLQKTEAQSVAKKSAEVKADAEARATEAALIRKEQKELLLAAEEPPSLEKKNVTIKTKITNVEVVNRSRDRSRVTFGVEFELKDKFDFKPFIGVKILSSDVEGVDSSFGATPVKIEKRKKFALLPVEFSPSSGEIANNVLTDTVEVYVTDESGNEHVLLDTITLPLTWRTPGAAETDAMNGAVALQEFRQRSSHSGYATVKYSLLGETGRLQVKVFDSGRPESVSWFDSKPVVVSSGRGLELVPVKISQNGGFPGGDVSVDTIEVELLSESGDVIQKVTRRTTIKWSKKKALAGK